MADRTENSVEPFYSKILLFGEYSIIFGSMALSIPFGHFTAGISFMKAGKNTGHGFAIRSNEMLKEYCTWLDELNNSPSLRGFFDIDAFRSDLGNGMFLDSDIPQGYGLGSSGALCAAVYERYAVKRIGNDPLTGYDEMRELKRIFATMESWFHGTSSGMDPLNCYFRRPILVEPGEKISVAGLPDHDSTGEAAIFLVDTGKSGKTEPLVRNFMERSRGEDFMKMVTGIMIPAVNSCIRNMIKPDKRAFMKALGTLSGFQLDNMKAMIPDGFEGVWERGLTSGDYSLKLCGSGGGGYLLGFADDMESTAGILKGLKMEAIPVSMNIRS